MALKALPRFAIYNRLNAWGRRREVPGPVTETFHQWYARTRGANGAVDPRSEDTAPETAGVERGRA
jgi:hypothetical protein